MVTFNQPVSTLTGSNEWIVKAFRDGAELRRREVAVIVKGILASRLQEVHNDNTLAISLRASNTIAITRCRRRFARAPGARYTTLILHLTNVEAARQLVNDELI